MDGSPYLDLLGTYYLRQVRPRGSQARVFSLSCEESTFSVNPVETPLHRLPFKREVLWEEVSSLLIKRAMEHVEMTCPRNGEGVLIPSFPHLSLHPVPSTGQRASSILQYTGSSLYVLSPSFVNSPERSLRREGRSRSFKADLLGVSGVPVNSGIWGLPGSLIPGSCSSLASAHSRPDNGCIHLWMGGGLQSCFG